MPPNVIITASGILGENIAIVIMDMVGRIAPAPALVESTVGGMDAVQSVFVITVGADQIVRTTHPVMDMENGPTITKVAPVIQDGVAAIVLYHVGMDYGAVHSVTVIPVGAAAIVRHRNNGVGFEDRQKAGRRPRLLGRIRPPAGRISFPWIPAYAGMTLK